MDIWIFDFFDIDADFLAIECEELLLEFCEVLSIFSEDERCTRGIDDDTETQIRVCDGDMTDRESFEKLTDKITDDDILTDSIGILGFIIISGRCPRAGDSDTP